MKLTLALETKVVENGTLVIDSIFRFSEEPTDLPIFLGLCAEKNCKVKFDLEKLVWDKHVLYSEEEGKEISSSLFMTAFISYITMFKRYSAKHFEHLTNMATHEAEIKNIS